MTARRGDIDLTSLIGPVARRLWGEPNSELSNSKNLRWGARGSKSVDLRRGVWFNHEANEGGGTLALIKRETGYVKDDALAWLTDEGLINGQDTNGGPSYEVASYNYVDE